MQTFPEIKFILEISQEEIETARQYVSRDELRPVLNNLFIVGDTLSGFRLASTDSHRLFFTNQKEIQGDVDVHFGASFVVPYEINAGLYAFTPEGYVYDCEFYDYPFGEKTVCPNLYTLISSLDNTNYDFHGVEEPDMRRLIDVLCGAANDITSEITFDLENNIAYSEDEFKGSYAKIDLDKVFPSSDGKYNTMYYELSMNWKLLKTVFKYKRSNKIFEWGFNTHSPLQAVWVKSESYNYVLMPIMRD